MRASEKFDWDKAIALFKGIDWSPSKCKKGLHRLDTPQSVYVSKEGFRRCRECTQEARRARSKPDKPIVVRAVDGSPRCRNGLHILDTPESVYVTKAGYRRCRACSQEARKKRSSGKL